VPSAGFLSKLVLLGLCSLILGYIVATWVQAERQEEAISEHAEQIFRSPTSFVASNPKGDVSVVAFFDYNCPYCRHDAPSLTKLIAADDKVRLVLKELPLLGADSEAVARIALAAGKQDKYFDLYERLISMPGVATKARALAVAQEAGLDVARLEKDMRDPAIGAALLENTRLAKELGVRGVPFYLVGDRVMAEGKDDFYGRLTQSVAEVRKEGCRAAC
jgi:protein-disulfide isomerase